MNQNNFNGGFGEFNSRPTWQPKQFNVSGTQDAAPQQELPQAQTSEGQVSPAFEHAPAPEVNKPEVDETAEFDEPAEKSNEVDEFLDDVDSVRQQVRKGERQITGWDKVGIDIALSTPEKTAEHWQKLQREVKSEDDPALTDLGSALMTLTETVKTFTKSAELCVEAFKKIAPESELRNKLVEQVDNFGINKAKVAKKYSNETGDVVLSGAEAKKIFTIITGGMRRVTLWNSGITVTVRNLTLEQISRFLHELNHTSYQYGREYGGLYYAFADLEISRYIVERLFPLVICGSSFLEWRDTDKLLKVIKWQDFHVIVWTLASMMYPDGASIKYVCSEPNCEHIVEETVDLTKMRLNNVTMINDKMIAHFENLRVKGKEFHTYEDILQYQKDTNTERTIEFSYGSDDSLRKFEVTLRQASVSDYLSLGQSFNAEMSRVCNFDDEDKVMQYIAMTHYRCFTPWIKSIKSTVVINGKSTSFVVNNYNENGDRTTDVNEQETIQMCLDEFRQHSPDFADKVHDFIIGTKISHIAFYFPECPKCHHKVENGYGGFIPYDPVHAFFTLGFSKLMTGASAKKE